MEMCSENFKSSSPRNDKTQFDPIAYETAPVSLGYRHHENVRSNDTIENLENVTLIWVETSVKDENYIAIDKTILTLLSEVNGFIIKYTDSQLCVDYIKSVHNEIIVLISCDTLAIDILPQIQRCRQLDSVFIFSPTTSVIRHVNLLTEYPSKVVGVFTDINHLIEKFIHRLHLISKHMTALSVFNQKQKSSRNITKESGSFLWFHLLFDVLKQFPQTEKSKEEMLEKFMNYYHDNDTQLRKIERFRTTYKPEDALTWYTEDCFLYRLLNKALRTEDIAAVYSIRFYLIDICKQLEIESRKNTRGTITVYRGQMMNCDELNKLKTTHQTLISTNSFFSTTLDKEVALCFLSTSQCETDQLQSILFEITANSVTLNYATFANINSSSEMPDEHEVLFNVGTVFEVDTVEFDTVLNVWRVTMSVSDEGMKSVHEYIEAQRIEYEEVDVSLVFGRLLMDMDESEKAEKYFSLLLQNMSEDALLKAAILDVLGLIHRDRLDDAASLQLFNSAYEIRKKLLQSDHPDMASSLINFARIFDDRHEHEQAIHHFEESLAITEKHYGNNHLQTAVVLFNFSASYVLGRDFQSAMRCLNRSLQIRQRFLPREHSSIAHTLFNIGIVYQHLRQYDAALKNYRDALTIYEKILPAGHHTLFDLLEHIVKAHIPKGDFVSAVLFCKQKLVDLRERLGEINYSVGRTQYLLALASEFSTCRLSFSEHDRADQHRREGVISLIKEAFDVFSECNPPEQVWMRICLDRISALYEKNRDYQMSLEYYMRTLELARLISAADHDTVPRAIRSIGRVHMKLGDYDIAEKCLTEALSIFKSNHSDDHIEVAITASELDKVVLKQQERKPSSTTGSTFQHLDSV